MGSGGKKKAWPKTWKQTARGGRPLILKGRSFEREYIASGMRVEADTPEELVEAVEQALGDECGRQRPS